MSVKIGYLGPQGTFAEEAARQYEPGALMVPYSSISEVFRAVQKNEVALGIVPVENSLEGSVNVTLDMLAGFANIKITAELVLTINQNLAARPGMTMQEITGVVSHPQALAQCREFLSANLPGIPVMKVNSTAEAARIVALNSETWAAVGNKKAAELYGLTILAENIQDSRDNKTRFIVLGQQDLPRMPNCKTSIIVSITDRPGGLYQILKEFALRNINLTKIESRPAKKNLGDYIFYIELSGHYLDSKVDGALKAVAGQAAWLRFLGSYPAAEIAKEPVNSSDTAQWTLPDIRADIDIIDYQVVELLAKRAELVRIVGDLKKDVQEIKDQGREQEVLTRVRDNAAQKGLDPTLVEEVYRVLFRYFVGLQKDLHKR